MQQILFKKANSQYDVYLGTSTSCEMLHFANHRSVVVPIVYDLVSCQ